MNSKIRTSLMLATTLSFIGAAYAQDQDATQSDFDVAITYDQHIDRGGDMRASRIIGMSVLDRSGEELGEIQDLVISGDDEVATAIISVGGILNIGDKLVGVPYDELRISEATDSLYLGMTREELEARPAYDEQRRVRAVDEGDRQENQRQARELQDDQAGQTREPRVTTEQAEEEAFSDNDAGRTAFARERIRASQANQSDAGQNAVPQNATSSAQDPQRSADAHEGAIVSSRDSTSAAGQASAQPSASVRQDAGPEATEDQQTAAESAAVTNDPSITADRLEAEATTPLDEDTDVRSNAQAQTAQNRSADTQVQTRDAQNQRPNVQTQVRDSQNAQARANAQARTSERDTQASASDDGREPTAAAARSQQRADSAADRQGEASVRSMTSSQHRVSDVIGATVVDEDGQEVGSLDDLVVSTSTGDIEAVLSVGGILGIGAKLIAVPLDEIDLSTSGDELRVSLGMSSNELSDRPEFSYETRDRTASADD